jgi:aryl-alcohol dehydrogenase-like predicted oxidoreductase
MAELRGWNRFVGLQIEYSLLERTVEKDLLPMAEAFGMAVTPWGALGGGVLTGKYLRGEAGRVPDHSARRTERATAIARAVSEVATESGCHPAQVALAWIKTRGENIIPIVGARYREQLVSSLGGVSVRLDDAHLQKLEEVSALHLGFPHEFLRGPGIMGAFGNALEMIHNRRVPGRK